MRISILSLVLISFVYGEEDNGFRFPGGDTESGKVAFERLNCVQCHVIPGVKLEDPKMPRRLSLSLTSKKRFVTRYQDIVTAITNPKHVVTKQYAVLLTQAELKGEIEALMPNMTEDMSVRQLMDLVAFLDKVYRANLDSYGASK